MPARAGARVVSGSLPARSCSLSAWRATRGSWLSLLQEAQPCMWDPSSAQPALPSGGTAGRKPLWVGHESGSAWGSHPGGGCPLLTKAGWFLGRPLLALCSVLLPEVILALPWEPCLLHPGDVGSDGGQPWTCSIIIRKMMWSRPCPTADTPLQEPGSALQLH